jgi:uncharacterized protein YbjQ (UPF0145 family)
MWKEVIVVTSPTLPGYRIVEIKGIAHGLTARTRGVGGKILAGLQSIAGGEVSAYTYEIEKAKSEALERLKESAKRMGANAVISTDFETTDIFGSVVLIAAHGTAVVVERE